MLELVFLAVPIVQAGYFSLTRWDGITSTWIGIANYQRLFGDPTFWRVVENNLLLLASVPFAILIPLLVAYLLNEHVPGWRFFRSAYFLPTAISWVVIGMVALRLFAVEGILNHMLARSAWAVHTDMLAPSSPRCSQSRSRSSGRCSVPTRSSSSPGWRRWTATSTRPRAWTAPGLHDVPQITIPMLMRFIQFAFILTLITAFTALFSLIFVMTGGGPGFGTTTLEFYVYQQGFKVGAFGYAAAIGIVLFAIVFAISIAQLRLFRGRLD